MKVFVLRTGTVDCENKFLSLTAAGHEIEVRRYDDVPFQLHGVLVEWAKAYKPDAIVYIGACPQPTGIPVPSVEILSQLNKVAPSIHLCSDAGDKPWWEWLDVYDKARCFAIQVSIDGNFDTPIKKFERGKVLLTPTDPRLFEPMSWDARPIFLGTTGSRGHSERQAFVQRLDAIGMRHPDGTVSYADMCKFMCSCRLIANNPMTGSGNHRRHVKGRVLEAGWAGVCLLEGKNPYTSYWFSPGIDYIEYTNPDDAVLQAQNAFHKQDICRRMAENLAHVVKRDHNPEVFWNQVFVAGRIKH